MTLWQSFILSLIQGITEFLPISSSGHLVITRELLHWQDAGVAFDAFTGLGTLTAVLFYYRKDVCSILYHWFRQFRHCDAPPAPEAKLGNQLIVATLPALLIGFMVKDHIDALTHRPLLIASTTMIFAIFLAAADFWGRKKLSLPETNYRQAFYYGLAQTLALVPGVSRSGITLTAGLAMHFSRESAARFSFLQSIPISAAAGGYGLWKLATNPSDFSWQLIALSYVTATLAAYVCIALFIRFLNTVGMMPHVIYRLLLGAYLFFVFM